MSVLSELQFLRDLSHYSYVTPNEEMGKLAFQCSKALLTTLYLNLASKEFTPKCNIITPPLEVLQILVFQLR